MSQTPAAHAAAILDRLGVARPAEGLASFTPVDGSELGRAPLTPVFISQ